MKILHVNKFLYRRGGAESYMLDVARLQESAGHQVAFFTMRHPNNLSSAYEQHFPENVELEPIPDSLQGKLQGAGRLLYSTSSLRGMARVLREFRPDVVHLHNIYHQLSPSILRPISQVGVPAVMTLHDYKLACPTYRFLDHGEICEACLGGHFRQAALRRCNRGSLVASSLNAVEMRLHTSMRAYAPINLFLCPSRFMATKMQGAGVFPERMRHLPHFVEVQEGGAPRPPEPRVVFAGRLSAEKGVDLLIRAAGSGGFEVDIAGEGPQREEWEELAKSGSGPIRFHGRLSLHEVRELIRGSAAAVLPARWYENQPLSVLDSFGCGVPVVGTDLGGIPELIDHGVDGYLVPPEDFEGLREKILRLVEDPVRSREMGSAGLRKVRESFSVEGHLTALGQMYSEAAGMVTSGP